MVASAAPRSTGTPPAAPPKFVALIRYAIDGDLRFLAHHDELRMLFRALVRARWPVAFSHGFNPRPHVKIPLPRNLGTAASDQVALAILREPRDAADLHDGLAAQLRDDCPLRCVIAPAPPGTPHPLRVTYELCVDRPDQGGLAAAVAGTLAQAEIVISRDDGPAKPRRPFDIRPYIEHLETDGDLLRMALRFVAQRTARPSEIITALGLAAESYVHRLRRAAVQWDMALAGPDAVPAATERTEIDNEEITRNENK